MSDDTNDLSKKRDLAIVAEAKEEAEQTGKLKLVTDPEPVFYEDVCIPPAQATNDDGYSVKVTDDQKKH